MTISIITLFPEIFPSVLDASITGRAQKKGLLTIRYINLREFGIGNHQQVDDSPYGGGVGLIFKADVLAKALEKAKSDYKMENGEGVETVVLTSASGSSFKQTTAKELAKVDHLIIICGHYEGVDQRFIDMFIDREISIGDFVLTGGEIPAMAICDSIIRLIPGVLEKEEATKFESFEDNLLEYPQYTRPAEFEGVKVPDILISGHHKQVEEWRKEKALEKTRNIRPDLLKPKE